MASLRRIGVAVTGMLFAIGILSSAAVASSTTSTTAPSGVSATTTSSGQIIVSSFSEKGDGIDNGVSSVYSTHWVSVTATTTNLFLAYHDPVTNVSATYSFAPVAGESLVVGQYDNAQRTGSRSAGFAGIDITGPGRPDGCPRVTGGFHVWDIAANADGTISRLDLSFVEHCGAGKPSNFGEVIINDAPHLGSLLTSSSRIIFPDQTPTLPYVVTNPTAHAQPISLWQSATKVSHFTLTALKSTCASAVPAKSSCTYLIRLLPPKPGMYTATVLVSSAAAIVHLSLSGPAGGA